MEHVLSHFKGLEKQAKAGDFNHHPGIQNSITEAWNKANSYRINCFISYDDITLNGTFN
jgi:hypothetical protein